MEFPQPKYLYDSTQIAAKSKLHGRIDSMGSVCLAEVAWRVGLCISSGEKVLAWGAAVEFVSWTKSPVAPGSRPGGVPCSDEFRFGAGGQCKPRRHGAHGERGRQEA